MSIDDECKINFEMLLLMVLDFFSGRTRSSIILYDFPCKILFSLVPQRVFFQTIAEFFERDGKFFKCLFFTLGHDEATFDIREPMGATKGDFRAY